jgi:hypothetical protein
VRSKTQLTVAVLGTMAGLVLAGCTPDQTGGTPTTGSSTATTSSAPAIANPLDTTKLQQNLCGGLTPGQLAPYVGTVRKNNTDNEAKYSSCQLYPNDTNLVTVGISVFPNLTVSDMIATGANYPYSKNLAPVQGYPAQSASQGNPPTGECATSVAVADHVVVSIEAQTASKSNQYYNNMCAVSEALAPELISNLKASG